MSIRKFLLFAIFFPQILNSCNSKEEIVTGLPHIILCMSDDQGWGDMSNQGHPVLKTPNLDEMAKNGIRFDRFYAAAPVCSPTRVSVLTGRHPNRMGCFSYGYDIHPKEITIPQMLKKKSYKTAHFGKWHIGSTRIESLVNPGKIGFDYWLSSTYNFEINPYLSRNGKVEKIEAEGSIGIVEEALKFIKEHKNSDQPLFIVIWFSSPHGPHQALKKHKKLYSEQPNNYKDFYAEMAALDEAMGKLRKGLKKYDMAENTLLWFNGDNGGLETLGITGGSGSKGSLLEGGLLVPGIVEWPAKIPKGTVSNFPAYTCDIFPTVLDIVEMELSHDYPIDGVSLLAEMEKPGQKREKPIFFWDYYTGGIANDSSEITEFLFKEQEGLVQKPEKNIYYSFANRKFNSLNFWNGHAVILSWPYKFHRRKTLGGPVQRQLYDLEKDKYEASNITFLHNSIADSLNLILLEWQKSVNNSYQGADYVE